MPLIYYCTEYIGYSGASALFRLHAINFLEEKLDCALENTFYAHVTPVCYKAGAVVYLLLKNIRKMNFLNELVKEEKIDFVNILCSLFIRKHHLCPTFLIRCAAVTAP